MALSLRRALPAALLLLACTAGPAPAATLPGVPIAVGADDAVERRCSVRLLSNAVPGVRVTPYTSAAAGALTVRTRGQGDWDLGLFDAGTGRPLAGSATFGATEMATAYLAEGDRVAIQACRRSGSGPRLDLGLDFYRYTPADLAAGKADDGPARLVTVSVGSKEDVGRLEDLGLDVTHQATRTTVDVAVYGDRQLAKLRRAGFRFSVRVADMVAADRRARRAERAAGETRSARALPSERTTYRTYAEYGEDLKDLADRFPGHVKPVVVGKSLENRDIQGVEIAADVAQPAGRPIFLLAGLTHAREWPSGENAIEFAIDIAQKFGTDPEVTETLRKTRVIVTPMLNPDGYVVSRDIGGAAQDEGDDSPSLTTLPLAISDSGAYKRKNCRPEAGDTRPCALRSPFGVDLNRAYGAFWGGDGSSDDPTTQQYRGTAPFSEPEAQAVQQFGRANHVQTFITNHTFTDVGRLLRQPGFQIENDPVGDVTPDEAVFAKLGEQMADATGYVSELGYATLGNITGPSDDYLYYFQGTIGYTPELRGDNFHTNYANAVIGEYEGEDDKVGRGLREAYLRAAQQAADPAEHSVLKGTAPAGRVLRVKKTAFLQTSEDEDGDGEKDKEAVILEEPLDTTTTVGPSGTYEWHVNPSTQPLAPAKQAYTFTCETPDGKVLETTSVTVDRGQSVTKDFACVAATTEPTPTPTPTPGATATPGPGPGASPGANPTPTPRPGTGSGGPGSTPGGTNPGTTPGGQPGGKPGTSARPRVLIRRPPASARRSARRGLAVYLNLRDIRLTGVRVRLVRRGRTIASGSARRLTRSSRVKLKVRRRPSAGRHTVVLTARDGSGKRIRVTRRVTLRR